MIGFIVTFIAILCATTLFVLLRNRYRYKYAIRKIICMGDGMIDTVLPFLSTYEVLCGRWNISPVENTKLTLSTEDRKRIINAIYNRTTLYAADIAIEYRKQCDAWWSVPSLRKFKKEYGLDFKIELTAITSVVLTEYMLERTGHGTLKYTDDDTLTDTVADIIDNLAQTKSTPI